MELPHQNQLKYYIPLFPARRKPPAQRCAMLSYRPRESNKDLVSELISDDLKKIASQIGFSANGDIIVSLLPVNESLPWITPAIFRPELVPEELMAQGLSVMAFHFIDNTISTNETCNRCSSQSRNM
jgi:hypothetical protein